MSSINGLGPNLPIQKTTSAARPAPAQAAPAPASGSSDKVELSGVGHLLQQLKANDIRPEKVAAIKAEIEKGTYETDAKLEAAIEKLMGDL